MPGRLVHMGLRSYEEDQYEEPYGGEGRNYMAYHQGQHSKQSFFHE